ncbi:MAG: type VI secretion system ImpA family N-terminal domain-containing protein [Holdemanella porci]|nr:type VI secretion system ImpA family N-terminal domain-containing protein [[Actinobacillus] rossii]MDY3333302.1 type VI secretion system ImpA family N-terminal domain-containing protein [Gallibacter sp.]MDY5473522.1 type VI secretion system ImpA family N-terminal domain-containing protein [Holdemanella porci]
MKLGKSPSERTEFMQIKEQINYLARPDKTTDWKKIKWLSEKLLLDNGTDLQTLVYLTVADYKTNPDFHQFTKNIELLSIALFSYWDDIWPQDVDARVNMLNWLNKQLSENVRASFSDKKDIKYCFSLANSLELILSTLKNKGKQTSNLLYLLDFVNKEVVAINTKLDLDISRKSFSIISLSSEDKLSTEPRINTRVEAVKSVVPEAKDIEVLDVRKCEQEHTKAVKNKKFFWLNLLFFTMGVIVSLAGYYFITKAEDDKINKQLEALLDSPVELVKLIDNSISKQEDTLKLKLQHKIENYVASGDTFIKKNTIKEKIVALQNDLLQAERKKQSITISQLKTALYELEREIEQMNCLECELANYIKTPDNLVLQKNIEHRFLSLLFYYAKLESLKSDLESNGKQYDKPTSTSPNSQ